MNFYKLIIPEVETNFDIILQESRYFVKLHEVYYNELYKMSNEARLYKYKAKQLQ